MTVLACSSTSSSPRILAWSWHLGIEWLPPGGGAEGALKAAGTLSHTFGYSMVTRANTNVRDCTEMRTYLT